MSQVLPGRTDPAHPPYLHLRGWRLSPPAPCHAQSSLHPPSSLFVSHFSLTPLAGHSLNLQVP